MATDAQIGDLIQINLAVKLVDKFGKTSFTVDYMGTSFTVHEQSVIGIIEAAHPKQKSQEEQS